jgi:hypothetical protein
LNSLFFDTYESRLLLFSKALLTGLIVAQHALSRQLLRTLGVMSSSSMEHVSVSSTD